ncbi:P-loop NTPase fold protein [Streptomyces erythrochromogenes]|uniref:P-loop NTPase fold protein n=1 Tax=Streptomyces erythrochromogenes TaxID=285574 RepID=UPI0038205E38
MTMGTSESGPVSANRPYDHANARSRPVRGVCGRRHVVGQRDGSGPARLRLPRGRNGSRTYPATAATADDGGYRWLGSGKSSLLKIVAAELAGLPEDETGHFVVVSFSPWQYEGYEDIKAALTEAVLVRLQQEVGRWPAGRAGGTPQAHGHELAPAGPEACGHGAPRRCRNCRQRFGPCPSGYSVHARSGHGRLDGIIPGLRRG